jgi:hypothetical protein
MIDVALVFKAGSVALSVAKCTGLIQDRLKLRVDQLASSELDAAVRALKQASESQNEQASLLREARSRFNKAIGLETDFRLAAAHLGLALCHSALGDPENAKLAIDAITKIAPPQLPTAVQFMDAMNRRPWYLKIDAVSMFVSVADPLLEPARKKLELAVSDFTELQREAEGLVKLSLNEGVEKVFGRQPA